MNYHDENYTAEDARRDRDIERKLDTEKLKECCECGEIFEPHPTSIWDDCEMCENCITSQENTGDYSAGETSQRQASYQRMK